MGESIEKRVTNELQELNNNGDVVQLSAVSVMNHWGKIMDISKVLFESGIIPDTIKTWQQASAVILMGMEYGMPPMYALNKIWIYKGKATAQAEAMLALVKQKIPRAVIKPIEMTDQICRIWTWRPGDDEQGTEYQYTYAEASEITQGGVTLTSKDNWKNYASDMLWARCVSRMKRRHYPDVAPGLSYTAEELGADVDEEGTPTKAPSQVIPEAPDPQIANLNKTLGTSTVGNEDKISEKQRDFATNLLKSHYFRNDGRLSKYKDPEVLSELEKHQATAMLDYMNLKKGALEKVEKILIEKHGLTKELAENEIEAHYSDICMKNNDTDGFLALIQEQLKILETKQGG